MSVFGCCHLQQWGLLTNTPGMIHPSNRDPDLRLRPDLILCPSLRPKACWRSFLLVKTDIKCCFSSTDYEKTENRSRGGTQKGTYSFIRSLSCKTQDWKISFVITTRTNLIFLLLPCAAEQKRRASSEAEKRPPRGHLRGLGCGRGFQIGTASLLLVL